MNSVEDPEKQVGYLQQCLSSDKKLEPRILIEDPEKSYHAEHRVGANHIFDNQLIFGDNLLALKTLEQEFAGKINASSSIRRTIQALRLNTTMMVLNILCGCPSCKIVLNLFEGSRLSQDIQESG